MTGGGAPALVARYACRGASGLRLPEGRVSTLQGDLEGKPQGLHPRDAEPALRHGMAASAKGVRAGPRPAPPSRGRGLPQLGRVLPPPRRRGSGHLTRMGSSATGLSCAGRFACLRHGRLALVAYSQVGTARGRGADHPTGPRCAWGSGQYSPGGPGGEAPETTPRAWCPALAIRRLAAGGFSPGASRLALGAVPPPNPFGVLPPFASLAGKGDPIGRGGPFPLGR